MRTRCVLLSLFLGLCGLGAHRALAPRSAAERLLRSGLSLEDVARREPPDEPGAFPASWIHGRSSTVLGSMSSGSCRSSMSCCCAAMGHWNRPG